jgi:tyrosyl-tRNA synthetase
MTLSEELEWRGFINQTTFKDLKELDGRQWTFYHGFDASAPSQTVGNLAALMFDKVFMRHGHKALMLAGGATSLIGDPGGKDSERVLQDEETIARNVANAEEQIKRVMNGHEFTLVNNLDWTRDMKVLDFLRDIGKHFSMTPLVQRDYIAKRLGEGGAGISYTEFSYTLLQGMDFLHLYDTYGCNLQLGGSDQWGNCLSGVELIRRARGAETHVITLPLIINKATGKKFGKSEEGAVWLDPQMTSPYKFYQFWLNADDEGAEGYLKIFTELDQPKVEQVVRDFNDNRASRIAQKTLAYEVTKLLHGEEQANTQAMIADVLFGRDDALDLTTEHFEMLTKELPTVEYSPHEDLAEAVVRAGLADSKSEARRFMQEGALYLNNQKIEPNANVFYAVTGYAVVRRGKNTNAIFRIIS